MFLLSVIVPVYNAEKYIDRCIESVLAMGPDVQIVLADDGSSDDSYKKCQKYARQNSNIVLLSETNQGPSAARNLALSKATGKYIIFCDADDWLDAGIIDELKQLSQADYDLIQFGVVSEFGNATKKEALFSDQSHVLNSSETKQLFYLTVGLKDPVYTHMDYLGLVTCKIYKRELIMDLLFDASVVGEDSLYAVQALNRSSRVYYLAAYYYHYRVINGTYSRRYFPGIVPMASNMLIALKRELHSEMQNDAVLESAYYDHAFGKMMWCLESAIGPKDGFIVTRKILKAIAEDKYIKDAFFSDAAKNAPVKQRFIISLLRHHMYSACAASIFFKRKKAELIDIIKQIKKIK